jgi:hypothetical protein
MVMAGMLVFGTCTVVTQKFLFQQSANGLHKYDQDPGNPHDFRKPWFQTSSMFIGMALALVIYEIQRLIQKPEPELMLQSQSEGFTPMPQPTSSSSHWKMYLYVAGPASCDLLATALMNIGLLWISASVWQMLRGSMVLFSSIFCAFVLKRPHYPYMWWSVLIVVIALIIVGFSSIASTGVSKSGTSPGLVAVAIVITVLAQVVQAGQLAVEDFLLHDIDAAPAFLVGLEGLWGTVLTWAIFIPIVGALPGNEGDGVHEDTADTFAMMGNNAAIIALVILYVLVILAYNLFGMMVTQVSSAVVRTILEAVRTLCIWAVQLIIHYASMNSKWGRKRPDLGEELTLWSILQFAGFLVLVTGTLLYNRIIEVPWFKYPPARGTVKPEIDPQPLISQDYE